MKAREAAYQALLNIEKSKAFANLALQRVLKTGALEPRDRGLCTELVYGTVQRQYTLDALLRPLSTRPLPELAPEVLTLLRMSMYQLAFLDKVPTYAVLDEAVQICKSAVPRASGFVNAVLRSYLRDSRSWREQLHLPEAPATSGDLALALSYPEWMVDSLLDTYGQQRTTAILEVSNTRAALTVRVNRMATTRDEVLARIHSQFGEIAVPSEVSPDGIRFVQGIDVESWEEYQSGRISVQDEGAMLIAPLLDVQPGHRVLDMCAAPGTKTTQIAERMQDQGEVVACDLHAHKGKLIRQGARRLGLNSVRVATADARLLTGLPGYPGSFDRILLDAPCSGLGVLRHRPDIRWKRTRSDIETLSHLQQQLLQAAVELVKPGGVIVYSTCTLLPAENDDVVAAVAGQTRRQVAIEPVAPWLPQSVTQVVKQTSNGVTLTPELFDTDGFYMARIRVD